MHAFWRPDTLARCGLAGLLVAALSAGCQPADDAREPDERTHLLIVVDGLRPDLVTAELTPVLHDLGQRGVVFTNHHAVFPTVTRVNAASISTGAYPAAHGLMGNTVYVPAVDAGSGVSTGSKSVLDAIALASDGRLLTATTLGEVLAEAGRSLVVLSSGTQGSGMLLNPTVAGGAVIHPDYTLPEELDAELADALGRRLAPEAEVADRTRWIVDVYLRYVVTELRPDVTILWMGDLDGASHASGVGSPEALAALEAVDGEIARIMATLDDVNLLVASDHGFSTLTGEMELDALLAPYTGTLADGLPDVVRAEGAIYVRDGSNGDDEDDAKDEKVARIVSALQRAPGYGAIFTRPSAPVRARRAGGDRAGDTLPGARPLGPRARGGHSGVGGLDAGRQRTRLRRDDEPAWHRRPRLDEPVRHSRHADRGRPGLPRGRRQRRADGERRPGADAAPSARSRDAGHDAGPGDRGGLARRIVRRRPCGIHHAYQRVSGGRRELCRLRGRVHRRRPSLPG